MEFFYIASVYSFITVLIYIFIIRTILRNKYNSSFYIFFLASSCIDIVCALNVYFGIRLPAQLSKDGWLTSLYLSMPVFVCRIIMFLIYHLGFLQYYMVLLMSLNRCTALITPASHDKFWYIACPAMMIISFLQPLVTTTHIAFESSPSYIWSGESQGVKMSTLNYSILYNHTLVFLCLCAGVVALINMITIFNLCCGTRNISKTAEINLLVISFVDSTILFIAAAFTYMLRYDGGIEYRQVMSSLLPYISDLLTFANAYLILICNSNFRNRAMNVYKVKRRDTVTDVTISLPKVA